MPRRILIALLVCGCGVPRVALPALPETDAPIEVRLAAQRQLSPVNLSKTVETGRGYLTLLNGEKIWHPQDLALLLAPSSATATSATRYDDRTYYGGIVMLAGAGAMLSSMGLMGVGLAQGTPGNLTSSPFLYAGSAGLFAGFLGVAVGGLIALLAVQAKLDAFKSWPADLKRALDL